MPISVKRPLKSLYIHVPFCKDKCYYCSFISLVNKSNQIENYIISLIQEINFNLSHNPEINVDTIYIGGGTPTLLEISHYQKIFKKIEELSNISNSVEITIEANPGTISLEYLKALRAIGINRISIGIQSFNNEILKTINRKHTSKEGIEAVKLAKAAGFENVSIDLIHGLPDQNLKDWENTLNIAASLNINHISAYGLKIEEGTRFAEKIPPHLPDEEISAEMYLKTIEILTNNGFQHYEISNFAKPGYESRHNLAYWHNEEYYGFGLAAHGYVNGVRYSNTCNFNDYLKDPIIKSSSHTVTTQEAIEEGIFLGLRLTKGIDIEKFNEEYGINILEKFENIIDKYKNNGFMEIKKGHLSLTNEGILISNTILADFLE